MRNALGESGRRGVGTGASQPPPAAFPSPVFVSSPPGSELLLIAASGCAWVCRPHFFPSLPRVILPQGSNGMIRTTLPPGTSIFPRGKRFQKYLLPPPRGKNTDDYGKKILLEFLER